MKAHLQSIMAINNNLKDFQCNGAVTIKNGTHYLSGKNIIHIFTGGTINDFLTLIFVSCFRIIIWPFNDWWMGICSAILYVASGTIFGEQKYPYEVQTQETMNYSYQKKNIKVHGGERFIMVEGLFSCRKLLILLRILSSLICQQCMRIFSIMSTTPLCLAFMVMSWACYNLTP